MAKTIKISIAILAFFYLLLFGVLGFLVGGNDFDHLASYYEIALRFWKTQSGLPHFNPYLCGGRTLGGDPQIPIFHPFLFFAFLVGSAWWVKLEMLLQLALGTYGLTKLIKRLGGNETSALWGIFLFLSCGAVVNRFMVGHVTLGFFFLFPLIWEFSFALTEKWELRLFTLWALLLAYCGLYKPNFFIIGVPILLIEGFFRTLLTKNIRPLLHLALAIGLAGAIDAVSILPAWKYFHDFPRLSQAGPHGTSFLTALLNFLVPAHTLPAIAYDGPSRARHEYNYFLGIIPILIAFRKKTIPALYSFCAMGVFCLMLGLGSSHFDSLSPYNHFRRIWPGAESIRIVFRFWTGTAFSLILLSALAIQWPQKRWKQAILFGLGILPLLLQAGVNLSKPIFLTQGPQFRFPSHYPPEIEMIESSHPDIQFPHIRNGSGIINCVPNLECNVAPDLKTGKMLPTGARWLDWSLIEIANPSPKITLNLNHSDYWKSTVPGIEILSTKGERLTLKATTPGSIEFHQPLVKEALMISLFSLFVLFAAYIFFRR